MLITEIQRFCMHDGPGLRTVVFMKGCPLHCVWCHNPETQSPHAELLFDRKNCIGCRACGVCANNAHTFNKTEHELNFSECTACGECAALCPTGALSICGRSYTEDEALAIVGKDCDFYGKTGGVTVSGGEPFFRPHGVISFLKACKNRGIHTAAETCGCFSADILPDIVPITDLFLWDIKLTDPAAHKRFTGVSNETILRNLRSADQLGALTRLRCILINGINTDTVHYDAIADIARSLKHCEGVEFIPYHAYAGSKAVLIGREDNGVAEWIPSDETTEHARRCLSEKGICVL